MKVKLLAAAALALASVAPASAANFLYSFQDYQAIPVGGASDNAFAGKLADLGMSNFALTLASLELDGPAWISVDYLGAESLYDDSFTLAGNTWTEHDPSASYFDSPVHLGNVLVNSGSGTIDLASLLQFSGPQSIAGVGSDGLTVFLGSALSPTGTLQSGSGSVIYLGFDDQNDLDPYDDDNHDDMIIRLTASPVPESATWAMLLSGFAVIGAAMRRRTSVRRLQAV